MGDIDPRQELRRELRRHPRVKHQGLFETPAEWARLADNLPPFQPFKSASYASVLWVLDWDHRLPSRELILRVYVYYRDASRGAGLRGYQERLAEIEREEIFPEFDVPDFSGLPADEAYETEIDLKGTIKKFRLVSDWRRDVDPKLGQRAEEIVRQSTPFKEMSSQVRARSPGLGDLEAAEWAAPMESGHTRWGLDVWFLRSFNGMVGEGTAFLVDLEEGRVVGQRDFQFRAG